MKANEILPLSLTVAEDDARHHQDQEGAEQGTGHHDPAHARPLVAEPESTAQAAIWLLLGRWTTDA